jgi:hypothetical protein
VLALTAIEEDDDVRTHLTDKPGEEGTACGDKPGTDGMFTDIFVSPWHDWLVW